MHIGIGVMPVFDSTIFIGYNLCMFCVISQTDFHFTGCYVECSLNFILNLSID
jgi:hypothetical protein